MRKHMVPALVDICADVSWLNWKCLSPVLLLFMHINEPTCFVLACFQVPSLAPDCFLSRHEASERFSGSFPGGVSLSELYLPVINIIRRSRLYDRQEKRKYFPTFQLKSALIMPCFQAKYELLLALELRPFTLSPVELQFEASLLGHFFLLSHVVWQESFPSSMECTFGWPYNLNCAVKTRYLVLS